MAEIKLESIHLSYPVYGSASRDFKNTLIKIATGGTINKEQKIAHVEALKDISFSLKKGDKLALIGHNGSGKSTLLKLLAKIYTPSQGKLLIKGKTSCLFDIMMGMDSELNGYENIMLRSRIAGLTKKEALEIIPKVEEFSELGEFMKMPFKTYSAGMQVRLAFGIITNIFAEILLIDEVLNVGDANFVKKAELQMENLVNNSEILVVCTHDINTLRKLCNKAIWLEHGKIRLYGDIDQVINAYSS